MLVLLLLAVPRASAQNTVIQTENVRSEYAKVLRVEPVYQTLRATSMVQRCEQSTLVQREGQEPRSGLGRVFGAVKEALTPGNDDEATEAAAAPDDNCRMVPVDREFRRPIAYDVDYVHHGIKYRSRLPYDPGNRVRVRVSVTPIVSSTGAR